MKDDKVPEGQPNRSADGVVAKDSPRDSLLSVRDLCIWFGGPPYLRAVNHASLDIGHGEIVGLIGQSGSGKTTLAMGLLGLVKGFPGLWQGTAQLDGKALLPPLGDFVGFKEGVVHKKYIPFQNAHRRQLKELLGRDVATIFQEPKASLDPFYTVGEHMLEALARNRNVPSGDPHGSAAKRGVGSETPKQIGVTLLKDVGLVDAENLWGLYPHEISGGMAQRVMISMALCAKPKLLIADEPSTSLDVTTQAKLLDLFVRLRDKHGLSILIISHDIGVIREISSRVYVMHRGSVVESGVTEEVLARPKHPYTASLLDSFSRFGEKLVPPPPNPELGEGCAYREMCRLYRDNPDAGQRGLCETRKPEAQKLVNESAKTDWACCHFENQSKSGNSSSVVARSNSEPPKDQVGGEVETLVELRGLRRRFSQGSRSFLALNDISLSIPKGKTYGLVGESGSGKSTLALSLMALQPIDAGSVLYGGKDVLSLHGKDMRVLRRDMRMLFQHPEGVLNSGMTIADILAEGLERERGIDAAERKRRVAEALEQVRLDPSHGARYPSNLSSGEKQRVTIARALITKPAFLVCDEPVASLDLAIQSQIISLLKDLQTGMGLSYLFISHNLALVKILADRIGVMYMGYLVEEARVEHFSVDGVRHPYSRLLLASAPSLHDLGLKKILADYPDVEPERLEGGCPFRNRCPLYLSNRLAACEKEMPALRDFKGGERVACHQIQPG